MARLRVVVQHRGGLGLRVLQHWLNLWPSQKARTQRLIPDALRQFLDDPGGRSPGGVRLSLLSPGLIQAGILGWKNVGTPLWNRNSQSLVLNK